MTVTAYGGMSWKIGAIPWGAPWPWMRIRIDEHGVELGRSDWTLGPIGLGAVPHYRFRWDEIESAELVKGRFNPLARGVRLAIRGRKNPITFWTMTADERISDALEQHGVTVKRPSSSTST